MAQLTVVADQEAVAMVAAARIIALIDRSIDERGTAVVCLTGGRTPERTYKRLADAPVDWSRVHVFWGDERHVPPHHPDSNFGVANRAFLGRVRMPAAQVHRIPAELPDAFAAAREYEKTLRDGFAQAGRVDQTFDVMLLGLGEDGHIASIFPGSPLLASDPMSRPVSWGLTPSVAAVFATHLHAWRITLTPPALLDARAILLIVAGTSKADAVHAAFELPDDPSRWPVQLLRGAGERLEWVIDEPAAARLRKP